MSLLNWRVRIWICGAWTLQQQLTYFIQALKTLFQTPNACFGTSTPAPPKSHTEAERVAGQTQDEFKSNSTLHPAENPEEEKENLQPACDEAEENEAAIASKTCYDLYKLILDGYSR